MNNNRDLFQVETTLQPSHYGRFWRFSSQNSSSKFSPCRCFFCFNLRNFKTWYTIHSFLSLGCKYFHKKTENEATRAKIHALVLGQNSTNPAIVYHEQKTRLQTPHFQSFVYNQRNSKKKLQIFIFTIQSTVCTLFTTIWFKWFIKELKAEFS